MDEIRALSVAGMIGSGFLEESLKRAMEWAPHFIAADAGATDGGPDALAIGGSKFPSARCAWVGVANGGRTRSVRNHSERMESAIRSPHMMLVMLVLQLTMSGCRLVSATRRPSTPWTRPC